MTLHRSCRDEECLRDLAVREALARELGDPKLTRGERIDACQHDPARPRAGGAKFRLGLFGESRGPDTVSGVESLAKELSRLGAAIAPSKHRTEIDESSRSFQFRITTLERINRLAQQLLATIAAGHDAGGATRHADRAWRTELHCKLELFTRKPFSRFAIAERQVCERSLRPPRQERRRTDHSPRQDFSNCEEVREPLGDAALSDPQPAAGETKDCGRDEAAVRFGAERRERPVGVVEPALIQERLDASSLRP